MSCMHTDLTIDIALADPMIGAVMRADRVDPERFEAWLRFKALSLGQRREEPVVEVRAVELRPGPALPGARTW